MNRQTTVWSGRAVLILQFAICNLQFAIADDWPQFRGPNRDDVSKETGLLKQWPKEGPKPLWTYKNAGVGYSGPAIAGDRLYTMGARGDSEYVFALDLKTAKDKNVRELWAAKIGPIFRWPRGNNWNEGPSATPTVNGNLVFALSGQGELVCVDTGTGKERWRKNLPRELKGEVNPIGGGLGNGVGEPLLGWGYTCSPLVDGQQLVCVPGGPQGMLAALDKEKGDILWQSKELTEQATYASPIVVEIGGVRQYIQMTQAGVAGVAAKDGKLLWQYLRKDPYPDVVIPTPIYHDSQAFITADRAGCDLVKITQQGGKFKAVKEYANRNMSNAHGGGVVLVDGRLYGHSGARNWVCLDFKPGKLIWSAKGELGKGSLPYADGYLYCLDEEEGMIALVEATPDKPWHETGRFQLPQASSQRKQAGKVWTHPVVANGRLYLRDQELLFCYDVKGN